MITVIIEYNPQAATAFSEDELTSTWTTKYGGTISMTQEPDHWLLEWTDSNQPQLLNAATSGHLDKDVLAAGAIRVREISKDRCCIYQYVPHVHFQAPSVTTIGKTELLDAIDKVDVLIITATQIEEDAVLDHMQPWPGKGTILKGFLAKRTYRLGQFGQYCAAHTTCRMGGGGRAGSLATTLMAIQETLPKAVIMVGIAFGRDRCKQRLGDVIIAESVVPYDPQRIGQDASGSPKVEQRGTAMQCGIVLSDRFHSLSQDWRNTEDGSDVQVDTGQILSADKLVDNEEFRAALFGTFPNARGGEMEGHGVYAAAAEHKSEVILVKAICDWADGTKNKHAQPFAARKAVSFAHYVLSQPDVLSELGAHMCSDVAEQNADTTGDSTPLDAPPSKIVNRLPIPSESFVGRLTEIAEARRLLCSTQLLTLTGTAGCGKTRLALKIGELVGADYPEGVHVVRLAGISDKTRLLEEVALQTGVTAINDKNLLLAITAQVRGKRLLILDNCEHLLDPCGELVTAIRTDCPDVTVLATSQAPLNMSGEQLMAINPLQVAPINTNLTLAELAEIEAIQLFVERSKARLPEFTLDEQNAQIVSQICTQLEGIPLAIELAAAWVRSLSLEQIRAGIQNRFAFLTKGRRDADTKHQSLRAALEWSYELLPTLERTLFERLSVFAGGWTLTAAQAVSGDLAAESVADSLFDLVDRSIVTFTTHDGEGRYGQLETLRQFGQELLNNNGKSEAITRHLDFYLKLAEEADPHLYGADQIVWLDRLDAEHDNFSTALTANCGGPHEMDKLFHLAGLLQKYWLVRGYIREGRNTILDFCRIYRH